MHNQYTDPFQPRAIKVPSAPSILGQSYAGRVESAREELADAEAALAARIVLAETTAKLDKAVRAHAAAVSALSDVRLLVSGANTMTPARTEFSEFRKELNEIVAPFGYKLIPVGDKSKCMLVLA